MAPEATMSVVPNSGNGKVTVPDLLQRKTQAAGSHSNFQKITCLTAYDYPTARLLDEAGVNLILVGDSLGMVVLGHENTLSVTIDEMLHHTRAVRRGTRRALVVADMPYGSYHTDLAASLHNAMRFVKEAGAEAVKVEGGERRLELISRLTEAEIPVMGHVGLTPQSVNALGGDREIGRAACRGRGEISVGAGSFKKKKREHGLGRCWINRIRKISCLCTSYFATEALSVYYSTHCSPWHWRARQCTMSLLSPSGTRSP